MANLLSSIDELQLRRILEAFRRPLGQAVAHDCTWQLDLFEDEDERAIQQAVEKHLYEEEIKLPNAGKRERLWIKWLIELSNDNSLVVEIKMAAWRYAAAFQKLLPSQNFIKTSFQKCACGGGNPDCDNCEGSGKTHKNLTLPGYYYTRDEVTPTGNRHLWKAAKALMETAKAEKNARKQWLAKFLLAGEPEAVSNFKMECLYLLRGADGDVTRLVRLVNTDGETSRGPEAGGTDVLDGEIFASAEKFRGWCLKRGNFSFGLGRAGNNELQMLHLDVGKESAYRVVTLQQSGGWREMSNAQAVGMAPTKIKSGIWFFRDGAIANGRIIRPDADGIIWVNGDPYMLSSRGREEEFSQGLPNLRLDIKLEELNLNLAGWDPMAKQIYEGGNRLGGFFRDVCKRICETLGGLEGLICVGSIVAYAAAPEIFARYKMFPGLFVPGQMGSGKTTLCGWLVGFHGFDLERGVSLMTGTAMGMLAQMENYSNVVLWLDEFRQLAQDSEAKRKVIHESYGRTSQTKITFGGKQREIKTAVLVSGESTMSDAATRSRFPHVQVSEHKREADHMQWFDTLVEGDVTHRMLLRLVFRALLERREEFVALVLTQMEVWQHHEDAMKVPSRDRTTHAVCYAAFTAATMIFESHGADEVSKFRRFLEAHTASAASDVQTDVNMNVFIRDVITAARAGAISMRYFRVERELVENEKEKHWWRYKLFMEPDGVLSQLEIYLKKAGRSSPLREKDLKAQLSQSDFWIRGNHRKRFGKKGAKATAVAWGIDVDRHPLGKQPVSDEELKASISDRPGKFDEVGPSFKDGDPRRGPLFYIIEMAEKYEQDGIEQEQEENK